MENAKFISIHAPLAGRDQDAADTALETQNFDPRAPCGARLNLYAQDTSQIYISIHAPLAGRDQSRKPC